LNDSGCGRTTRRAKLEQNRSVRILADTSLVEIYFNQGEIVFTSYYYPKCDYRKIKIEGNTAKITSWEMKKLEMKGRRT
jgi:beta-fructofuranosidase